jgi:hypothetical protein
VSGTRQALFLGAIPIAVGILYYVLQELNGSQSNVDPAGALMLVSLGLAMGFGMLVVLRGARDL